MARWLIAVLTLLVLALGLTILLRRPGAAKSNSLVRTRTLHGARVDVVELPLDQWNVRIGWTPGGTRLSDVEGAVRTNAGIFEPGYTPTGLLVSGGKELRPLEPGKGEGNFYLLPNGVFTLGESGAAIVEASDYDARGVREATQSGPLLVRRGELHPSFKRFSDHKALRSGVGVRGRTVVLVITRDDVNLWTLATIFRDELDCPNALYLDGVISALWAKDAGREADLSLGPFAGVITASPRGLH
jgi:uncharacterized protein YigE (DUF2233 family)